MKIILFGKNIPPACEYCLYAHKKSDGLICEKRKGTPVLPEACRKYYYEPTKRIPPPVARLQKYSSDDFSL